MHQTAAAAKEMAQQLTSDVTILKNFFLLSWAMWFVILQLVTATELAGLEGGVLAAEGGGVEGASDSVACTVCKLIPGLTPSQQSVCCDLPKAIALLDQTEHTMRTECRWQLRKELWNCSEIGMPIFRAPTLRETPEKAFIYALASATTVHRITSSCSAGKLGSECGCDVSRNGLMSHEGWQWGSCSDNVSYGIYFAQNFLDNRELDVNVRNSTAVSHAVVHLHNNAVGRKVISDNMKLSCRCHGLSGSCSVRTCWRELPTYYQVGDVLKTKYDNALKVRVSQSGNGPAILLYYDPVLKSYVAPSDSSLVYLEQRQDYCSVSGNFTRNRQCQPQALLDAQRRGEVKAKSTEEHFPPCEEFCCSGEYREETMVIRETCNCQFMWCCNVECQTCTVNITQYRCTG